MKANSIKGNSAKEIQEKLEKILTNDFEPNLAIVFSSVSRNNNAIVNILDKNAITVFGSTTAGEFIDGDYGNNSTAILLLEINPAFFKLYFEESAKNETQVKAQNLAKQAVNQFNNPAFIVAGSGLTVDGELIIRGIEDAAGTDTTIPFGLLHCHENFGLCG